MELIFTGIIIITPVKLNQYSDNGNNSPVWVFSMGYFFDVHSIAEIPSKTLQA